MKTKNLLIIFTIFIFGCNQPKDENYLGYVEKLPKGEYTIYNYGSRHMVKCVRTDGKYYMLNDTDFKINGIKGHDAHEYHNPAKIFIK